MIDLGGANEWGFCDGLSGWDSFDRIINVGTVFKLEVQIAGIKYLVKFVVGSR